MTKEASQMPRAITQENIGQIYQKVFQAEYEKVLKETVFHSTEITALWKKSAVRSLSFASCFAMQIKPDEFKTIKRVAEGQALLTMFAFGVINNNLEARSPKELGLNLTKYELLMNNVAGLAEQWQFQHHALRDKATKIATEVTQKISAEREKLAEEAKLNKENGGGKTVKMETSGKVETSNEEK